MVREDIGENTREYPGKRQNKEGLTVTTKKG